MTRQYSKRDKKEYNVFRAIFQWLTVKIAYGIYYRIACGMKVYGKENVPKNKFVIIASNHLSAIDPFLIIDAVGHPTAYMAKQELFEKPVGRFFMDWLGAFAVNREKLEVSTIKTAIGIKDTGWFLGLFPQGTREREDNMDNIARGFVKIAKILKCDILPIGIIGTEKAGLKPFKSKITLNIGKPIPYMEDSEKMSKIWVEEIAKLTQEECKPKKNYAKKVAKDFNILTRLYQLYALNVVLPLTAGFLYSFKYSGRKNIDKKANYIVAPNHISYLDAFLVAAATKKPMSFMAKKELFNNNYIAKNIFRLGAFSVNREKLEVSTIKSSKEVFKTKYDLCIFPQGGIRKNKKIEALNKGFIFFAKSSKRDILPIAINGLEEYNWDIRKKPTVNIKVGKPISYLEEDDVIVQKWREEIAGLTGYELCELETSCK